MFEIRRYFKTLGIGTLVCAAATACNQVPQTGTTGDHDDIFSNKYPVLAANCSINGSGDVTFTMASSETLYLFKRPADGLVVANAPSTASATECTFATTKKITINASANGNTNMKVLLDYYNGTFGLATAALNVMTPGVTGPRTIIGLGTANTGNQLKIRATANYDTLTFGTLSGVNYGTVAVGTATAAPSAKAFPDMTIAGVLDLVVSTGPGNDIITGQGGTPIGGTAVVPSITALAGTIAMTVYGGDGNDVITSGAAGAAVNYLYGENGNDLFLQQSVKAHDVISGTNNGGAADVDTVDYSNRTTALSVTLGDNASATFATGQITCVAKANLTNSDTFTLNDGTNTVTFKYKAVADAAATGSITVPVQANFVDNETLTLDDGVHAATVFEFDQSGTAVIGGGNVRVDISGDTTAAQVATTLSGVINGLGAGTLNMTAVPTVATIALTQGAQGSAGNTTISETVVDAGFTVTSFTGGSLFVAGGATPIDVTADTTSAQVATTTANAINAIVGGLTITAAAPSSNTIALGNDDVTGQLITNQTITESVADAGFAVTGMSGASPAVTANDGESLEYDSLGADIENVIGGSAGDTIDASLATLNAHVLQGMAGDDTLIGSSLADTLWGGQGDDTLKGGLLADTMNGGDGNDTLIGGTGNDNIDGGGFNCVSTAVPATVPYISALCTTTFANKSTVAGVNPGVNTLDYSDRTLGVTVDLSNATPTIVGDTASMEKDVVTAASITNLRGGSGPDALTGDSANNIIWGGAGNDTIVGGSGDDTIYGELGNDNIDGGLGNDVIIGGGGTNTLAGGAGNDLLDDTAGTGGTMDCGTGDADIGLPNGTSMVGATCH